MSTIKTDLLQNRLGTSHPAVTKADFVKAWALIRPWRTSGVDFGMTAVDASFSTTGITDNGVGLTFHHVTTPFVSVAYCHQCSLSGESVQNNLALEVMHTAAGPLSAGGSGIRTVTAASVLIDAARLTSSMLGALA